MVKRLELLFPRKRTLTPQKRPAHPAVFTFDAAVALRVHVRVKGTVQEDEGDAAELHLIQDDVFANDDLDDVGHHERRPAESDDEDHHQTHGHGLVLFV